MDKETKSSILIRYLVAFCVASFLFLSVLILKGFFTDNAKDNMHTLVDAFFASGVLMIMFYGLLFVSSEGAFLGIGFALGRALRMLVPFSKKPIDEFFAGVIFAQFFVELLHVQIAKAPAVF